MYTPATIFLGISGNEEDSKNTKLLLAEESWDGPVKDFWKTDLFFQERMTCDAKMDVRGFFKAPVIKMTSYDQRILHATEDQWTDHLRSAAVRAQRFELEHWQTREYITSLTPEQYLHERYFDPTDKKGLHHWRNLVASEMNSSKSKAGSSFENAIEAMAEESGVDIASQVWVDESGHIHTKKKSKDHHSVHKIDGYISAEDRPESVKCCYVVSNKTTLRERWNQDVWCVPLCKKLIILTREIPNHSTLQSIHNHGIIVVYPSAPTTEWSWSYDEFFRRMKAFQEST